MYQYFINGGKTKILNPLCTLSWIFSHFLILTFKWKFSTPFVAALFNPDFQMKKKSTPYVATLFDPDFSSEIYKPLCSHTFWSWLFKWKFSTPYVATLFDPDFLS